MEKQQNQAVIGQAYSLDDLIFQEKNKDYGAFELRQNYQKRVSKAFYIGATAFVLALSIPLLYAKYSVKVKAPKVTLAKSLKILPTPPPTQPIVLPPPPPVEAPKVASTAFLPPVITIDNLVADDLPPSQDVLKDAPPATETNLGDPGAVDEVIIESNKPEETIVKIVPEHEPDFVLVEQFAEYPGGNAALARFLAKNLKYPMQASNAGISGKVWVNFVVNNMGNISDVTIAKGIGFNCDEEAIRVIKAMPNWLPAKQSGRAVKSRFTLPIVFQLE